MPKESEKATITSFTGTGLVRVVDDSAGSPRSRNMAIPDLAEEMADDAAFTGRYGPIGSVGVRALVQQLDSGTESAVLQCLGDSTVEGDDEVFSEFLDWIGETWPAFSTIYRGFNNTNGVYDRRTVRTVGTSGIAYVDVDGTGDWINCPDAAGISLTGDQYGFIVHRADDWTPGSNYMLMMKDGGGGKRSFSMKLGGDSRPNIAFSSDGTNFLATVTSSAALPGLVNGTTDMAVGFTLDADNGAGGHDVKFWYATFDPTTGTFGTWTQLGTTQTVSGTLTVADHNGPLQVGANSAGLESVAGRIYYAEYGSGTDIAAGNPRATMDPSTWVLGTTFKDAEGNTWTLQNDATVVGAPSVVALNGAVASTIASDVTVSTRVPCEPALTLISFGHNYGTGSSVLSSYTDLIDSLLSTYPYSPIICSTQTPKSDDVGGFSAAQVRSQAIRQSEILRIADAKRVMAIDPFREMNAAADVDTYLADGIHPNAAGVALWLAHLKRPFLQWIAAD